MANRVAGGGREAPCDTEEVARFNESEVDRQEEVATPSVD